MLRNLFIVAAVVAAAPLPAIAEGNYSVRNDAGRAFSCGLRHERRSVIDRFVLRSGREWTQTAERDGPRTLLCDSDKFTQRWRMDSGVPYALVEDRRTGRVVLRRIAASR